MAPEHHEWATTIPPWGHLPEVSKCRPARPWLPFGWVTSLWPPRCILNHHISCLLSSQIPCVWDWPHGLCLTVQLSILHTFSVSGNNPVLPVTCAQLFCSLSFTVPLCSFPFQSSTYSCRLQQQSHRPWNIRTERALLQLIHYLHFTNEEIRAPQRVDNKLLWFQLVRPSILLPAPVFLLLCLVKSWFPCLQLLSLPPTYVLSTHIYCAGIFFHLLSRLSTGFSWSLMLGWLII